MFVGLDAFKAAMKAEAAGVINKGKVEVRSSAKYLFSELVRITPKDTNFASSKWSYVVGATPPNSTIRNPRGGKYRPASTPSFRNFKVGRKLYIYNLVAYIKRLNDGYSRQAPSNFVRNAARRADRRLQQAFNRIT